MTAPFLRALSFSAKGFFFCGAGISLGCHLENDDLGPLPAARSMTEFTSGVQLFDCERDCGDFLHELRADQVGQQRLHPSR